MARYLVVTTVHSVVDDAVSTGEGAGTLAESKITLSATGGVVSSGIVGSEVRSALSEINASLVSKVHGPQG